MNANQNDLIRTEVRNSYSKVAQQEESCCSTSSCCCGSQSIPTADKTAINIGYSKIETTDVPDGANMGLGCGNPQAIASLKIGETVLDLGSGGGFDAFLAARAVGKTGRVIGVDMTPEMVSKARTLANKNNFENVSFRLGEIEHLPVADETVDVIISNCVINLSPEKKKVFQDSFRVLKPGGRLAISDIIQTAEMPESLKKDMTAYSCCVSGASTLKTIHSLLDECGFHNITIKPKEESRSFIQTWVPGTNAADYVVSATIEAIKPV